MNTNHKLNFAIYAFSYATPIVNAMETKVILILVLLPLAYGEIATGNIFEDLTQSTFYDDVIKLVSNVINRTDPASVGFVSDTIFLPYLSDVSLTSVLNRQVNFITIKESESFEGQSVRRMTEMLKKMNEESYELVVILILNGVQMSEFLRFADYNRLLNVKSNCLMLYDYRLFGREFQYLWKRIVNVLFVRKYDRRPGNWYELSTVPFPLKIDEYFIPIIVNYWTPPNIYKKRKMLWVKKNEKELRGVELNVVIFRHTPSVYGKVIRNETTNYTGVEIDLIRVLSDKMNFTVNFYEPDDVKKEQLGRKTMEGNYTGLLGKRMWFAGGKLYIISLNISIIFHS